MVNYSYHKKDLKRFIAPVTYPLISVPNASIRLTMHVEKASKSSILIYSTPNQFKIMVLKINIASHNVLSNFFSTKNAPTPIHKKTIKLYPIITYEREGNGEELVISITFIEHHESGEKKVTIGYEFLERTTNKSKKKPTNIPDPRIRQVLHNKIRLAKQSTPMKKRKRDRINASVAE